MYAKNLIILLICLFAFKESWAASLYKDVLLIINYNHPHYESVPLIKKMYGPYFENIVFYGPSKAEGIHDLPTYLGFFSYTCIADAMRRYPTMQGYLFLMDDCILNPQLLAQHDVTKIWYPKFHFMYDSFGNAINLKKKEDAFPDWKWWQGPWGYKPTLVAYNQVSKKYKNMLIQNWGKYCVVGAYSDIAYIPQQYRSSFIELSDIFASNQVFLEIALPTIVACLCPKQEWLWLEGQGIDYVLTDKAFTQYNPDAIYNHPIKLSYASNRAALETIFTEQLQRLTQSNG